MTIGIPREIKNNENRVGVTPGGVARFTSFGHTVFVEQNAGVSSGFDDKSYLDAGAIIVDSAKEIYDNSEMIVKVKEPLAQEYDLIREGQILFTYFHFASSETLTKAMVKSKAICIAYETIKVNNTLPLLTPMSEVAGRMSIQQGAKYLEKTFGGKGILLGGVAGVPPANVLIIGGGVVGTEAAKMAAGLGANVVVLDVNLDRLRYLNDVLPANIVTAFSDDVTIRKYLKVSDLVIGGVLIPGAKAPKLITKDMLQLMNKGSVLVDVAVDQGGCIETTKPTTHENPIYEIDGVLHYAVANIPGVVPETSTKALTNVSLPYALRLANDGWEMACEKDSSLKEGVNIVAGNVVNEEVRKAFC